MPPGSTNIADVPVPTDTSRKRSGRITPRSLEEYLRARSPGVEFVEFRHLTAECDGERRGAAGRSGRLVRGSERRDVGRQDLGRSIGHAVQIECNCGATDRDLGQTCPDVRSEYHGHRVGVVRPASRGEGTAFGINGLDSCRWLAEDVYRVLRASREALLSHSPIRTSCISRLHTARRSPMCCTESSRGRASSQSRVRSAPARRRCAGRYCSGSGRTPRWRTSFNPSLVRRGVAARDQRRVRPRDRGAIASRAIRSVECVSCSNANERIGACC